MLKQRKLHFIVTLQSSKENRAIMTTSTTFAFKKKCQNFQVITQHTQKELWNIQKPEIIEVLHLLSG